MAAFTVGSSSLTAQLDDAALGRMMCILRRSLVLTTPRQSRGRAVLARLD
jgi:hypothetical protein